jgi:hypothetical protein
MADAVPHPASQWPVAAGSVLGSAIVAATSIYNTRQQIDANVRARISWQEYYQALGGKWFAHQLVQDDARFHHEMQVEAIRALRQRELALLEKELREKSELYRHRVRTMFKTYPIEEGPGHLRESLALRPGGLSALPLLVLLPALGGSGEDKWRGLRATIMNELRTELADDGLIVLPDSVYALSIWPHRDFYEHDLYGIPTLIMQGSCFRDTLAVNLGGCHLRPGAEIEELRTVYRHRLARPEELTQDALDEPNLSLPHGRGYDAPQGDGDLARLSIDLSARAVTAVVAAAVDAYYLGNQIRYRQRFDHVAAALGTAGSLGWPADLGVPIDQVADPAFHLLHVAARLAGRGQIQQAIATVRRSLAVLVHRDYAVLGDSYPPLDQCGEKVHAADEPYRQKLREVLALVRQKLATDSGLDEHDLRGQELADITRAVHE